MLRLADDIAVLAESENDLEKILNDMPTLVPNRSTVLNNVTQKFAKKHEIP